MTPDVNQEEALSALKALLAERVDEARRGELAQGGIAEIAETVLRGANE